MQDLSTIIDESIELELNAASLYLIFHFAFPEDANFWWQLHKEERSHASLLTSIKNTYLPADLYPEGMQLPTLEQIINANKQLNNYIGRYRKNPPNRKEAFRVALEVENAAGEIHFQEFTEKQPQSKIDEAFQNLISGDKDHLQRLLKYMNEKGIALEMQNSFSG